MSGAEKSAVDTGSESLSYVTAETSPSLVASIVEHRSERSFVLLLKLADLYFSDPLFEVALARSLRSQPDLVEQWETWSNDQRWTPSAYVDGIEAGWFDGHRRHVRIHSDRCAAVADFIHRLTAWLARREVLEFRT